MRIAIAPPSGAASSSDFSQPKRRPDNDRVVSARLSPAFARWLKRVAEESQLSEGQVAKRELERFLLAEAKRRLEADHAAELEALGATSPNPNPATEIAHDAG